MAALVGDTCFLMPWLLHPVVDLSILFPLWPISHSLDFLNTPPWLLSWTLRRYHQLVHADVLSYTSHPDGTRMPFTPPFQPSCSEKTLLPQHFGSFSQKSAPAQAVSFSTWVWRIQFLFLVIQSCFTEGYENLCLGEIHMLQENRNHYSTKSHSTNLRVIHDEGHVEI